MLANHQLTINWQHIDLVMFDMDGTLLDLAFDNFFWQHAVPQAWAVANGHSHDAAKQILYPQFKAQEGHLNWYSLPYWSDALQLDLNGLKQQHQDRISLRPQAQQLLEQLQQAGKTLWLVTNAHPQALHIKMQQTGIANYFEQLISSHDLGHAKEQAPFWQLLEQAYRFDKSRSIFIDDSESVLHAADAYGIQHVVSIIQPDSSLPARQALKFPALHQLMDLTHSL